MLRKQFEGLFSYFKNLNTDVIFDNKRSILLKAPKREKGSTYLSEVGKAQKRREKDNEKEVLKIKRLMFPFQKR